MKDNRQSNPATWGYVLVVTAIVILAFVLVPPHIPASMAQEPTRPAPGPTRPAPAPTRETPPPPTDTPPPTATPKPTTLPGTPAPPAPESPATATAAPPILPDSGGRAGDFIVLLVAGLALATMGISVTVIHRRRQSVE